jgi:phosphatidylserine/phosphatidylglycerophosphate/cardiolipin synthase-like enzyme
MTGWRRYQLPLFFTGALLLCIIHITSAQQPLSEVRLLPLGSVVTTSGTLTSEDDLGDARYMQDATAGIALFGNALNNINEGDSVLVTGVLSTYRGQLQLSPILSIQVLSTDLSVEALSVSDFTLIALDGFDARKVSLSCAGIQTCESAFESGWYQLYDDQGHLTRLWIAENHPIEGDQIPQPPFQIDGIWTHFEDQFQLLAQSIIPTDADSCFSIPPGNVDLTGGQLKVQWNDVFQTEGTQTEVEIGEETYTFSEQVDIQSGLISYTPSASTFTNGVLYKARLHQFHPGIGHFYSVPVEFAMPSPEFNIDILFNRSVNASFSDGSMPLATGSSVIETDLIERIDEVTSTLDIAMYNTGRASIVDAVERAVNRGVQVRYIADDETSNNALDGLLSFPVRFRGGDGIMHNKFVIADAAIADQAWLWSGSTNLSSNQLSTDPNHAHIIHDQGLALNYQREFDELWGALDGQTMPRYGDFKTNNTVHEFLLGDTRIESWFSPSDETNCRIIEVLQSADHQALVGLLLLTRYDLTDELIALHDAGIEVRIIVDDEESSAVALSRLRAASVPVVTHDPSAIFHHKYAIIDEGHLDSDPVVVTGSHNWTWSADNINDENTLIIHDQSVTNIFRQEFEARWKELNPTSVTANPLTGLTVYPNPAKETIYVINPFQETFNLDLINITGQIMFSTLLAAQQESQIELGARVPPGLYLLNVSHDGHIKAIQPIVVQ